MNRYRIFCFILIAVLTHSIVLFAQSPIVISPIPERCVNGNILNLNNYVTPSGGNWSSASSGLIQPDSFIPSVAGTGQHWVYYTYTDTSGTYIDSSIVTINDIPITSAGVDDSICSTSGFYDLYNKENPQTPPGDWRGTAVYGSKYTWYFDPADPALVDGGVYPLIYNYTDPKGCTNEDTVNITVFKTPVVNSGTYNDVCIDESFVKLSGAPSGGVWSGTGITGDYFYPATAGAGLHELTYTAINVICVMESKTTIHVNPLPVVTANTKNGQTKFCRTVGLVELDGLPSGSGGVWTGEGIQSTYFNTLVGADVERSYTLNYEYTDQNGCKNDKDLIITVRPEPTIEINATYSVLCFGTPYQIKASYKNADGVLWSKNNNKADGSYTGNVTDTSVGYNPGTADFARLNFWLNIETTHSDNVCPPAHDSIRVKMSDMPVPGFWADPLEGCTPLIVQFYDSSTIGLGKLDKYKWEFGDGGTSTVPEPLYTYGQSGRYTVTLSVTSDAGCEDLTRKFEYIVSNVVPVVTFIPHPGITLISVPTITFENTTINETDGIKYRWNFGDYNVSGGGISTNKNTAYKFSDTGHYEVQLYAINEYGCDDSFMRIVVVLPDEYFNVNIKVYPNPAKNQTTVENTGLNLINSVLLYNSLGLVVRSYTDRDNHKLIISRDGLRSGIYIFKIKPYFGKEVYIKVIFY